MKLRIKGDSLRFRLTKTDIETLDKKGMISEETNFTNAVLYYRLQRSENTHVLTAGFENNIITISIPHRWATELIKTERVGYETNVTLSNGSNLYLLIEKDFKCLDETIEDQSDNYDNPIIAKNDEAAG